MVWGVRRQVHARFGPGDGQRHDRAEVHLTVEDSTDTQAAAAPRSDDALVAAMNGGDLAAFEAIYFRYRDWVVRVAFRLTGDRELALDVLQETFLYFLKKFPGFRLTARLPTFLYPVVRNLSIAARKHARRLVSDDSTLEAIEAPGDPATPASARGELAAVLSSLGHDAREVLLLRFVDDLSLAEIAQTLRIPLGTVKSRLHNALEALRRDERTKEFFSH